MASQGGRAFIRNLGNYSSQFNASNIFKRAGSETGNTFFNNSHFAKRARRDHEDFSESGTGNSEFFNNVFEPIPIIDNYIVEPRDDDANEDEIKNEMELTNALFANDFVGDDLDTTDDLSSNSLWDQLKPSTPKEVHQVYNVETPIEKEKATTKISELRSRKKVPQVKEMKVVQRREKKNHREKLRRQTMSNKFEELFTLLSCDERDSHGLPSSMTKAESQKKWNKTEVLSSAIQTIKNLQLQVNALQHENSKLKQSPETTY